MKTPFVGLLMVTALGQPLFASAQQPAIATTSQIAYVSAQRLSTETTAGKLGLGRVQALQQQKATELRAKQQELESTRHALSSATETGARLELLQQEQRQRIELERAGAQAQAEIQTLQRQMAADLQSTLRSELAELVKGTSIQVVLQLENSIVWAAPGLDLTPALIARMNATAAGGAGAAAK